ncbi:MAG: hypothetical protein HZA28_04815 [Candidatus Omnitrophica bacterium]|nr:hypothetical protein [Candidatus Omnitrophota bacterium]
MPVKEVNWGLRFFLSFVVFGMLEFLAAIRTHSFYSVFDILSGILFILLGLSMVTTKEKYSIGYIGIPICLVLIALEIFRHIFKTTGVFTKPISAIFNVDLIFRLIGCGSLVVLIFIINGVRKSSE